MKVGFDAKRLYNNFTGLGNHSRTTLDILMEYFPENAYFLYTPKIIETSNTSPYISSKLCKTNTPSGMLKGGLWRTFGLTKELKKDSIDLFHGLSNELPVGLDIPSVVTIHDVAFHTFPDMYHWIDRQIYDMKWRYACKRADRIIAISECTKLDIIKYYDVKPEKIDVVYQPVAPSYYKEEESQDSPLHSSFEGIGEGIQDFILYVGSINSRKNLLGIVKAIELLPKDLQIPLIVVGGGREYKAEVQRYIAEHHLERLVIFPQNRIEDEELHSLYRKAKAFVYPSFYEGFGLPVVEALLSNCPVITSNVSSLPEAGGPFSLKAAPDSIEDISQKIQQVLTDSSLSAQMRIEGKKWATNTFHPEVLAKRLMEVYDKTIFQR